MYNELCSTLLGVQVTLSQNKPQSMTAQDRNAAAARFQSSMQVPIQQHFRICCHVNTTCQIVPHLRTQTLCNAVFGLHSLCCASM